MSHRINSTKFRRSLIALAISAALSPTWALDLAESPPGTVEPYVRPNVIISIDDSGSMNYKLDSESSSGANDRKEPDLAGGGWSMNSRRINVLKYALIGNNDGKGVFNDTTLLSDKKIRLGWQVMHNNGKAPNAKSIDSDKLNTNSIKIMDDKHRTKFKEFINGLVANNGTPSHLMFSQADAYMRRPLSKDGPWASEPGEKGAPYLGCRRNYHIIMTDGRWNGTASSTSNDNNKTNITLPDKTIYGKQKNGEEIQKETQLYSDSYSGTLADWAFYSWSKPLQENYKGTDINSTTTLYGTVEPDVNYRKAEETENFGKDSAKKDAILKKYWNPKYNPATWPHMVTYTIGFSAAAYTWPGATDIKAPSKMVPFGYDGSFPDLVTGNLSWPKMDNENKRSLDLWHAALNGRGRFYAVEKGEDLETAFREIFQQINSETGGETTTSAVSGTNTSRDNVGRYTSKYEPRDGWKGYVYSEILDKDGKVITNPAWNGKNTAEKLDARKANYDSRLILSWKSEDNLLPSRTLDQAKGEPIVFNFENLSATQKGWLNKNALDATDTKGSDRDKFIRGDTSNEGDAAPNFRKRTSIQGDIINSAIWYTSWPNSALAFKGYSDFAKTYDFRTPMLYVGGNDGMLHGFSAIDGEEKIAYIPRGAIPKLRYLADQGYNDKHKFFVDGSPMTGDVDVANTPNNNDKQTHTPNWRTLLVGSMGLGGKGYFILDVTNPGFSPKPKRAWESADQAVPSGKPNSNFSSGNASELIIMDRTRSSNPNSDLVCDNNDTDCQKIIQEDADIGHITAEPVRHSNDILRSTQFAFMNNNRWAVVMGNGYNSKNQRPVLLVQYLDGTKELLRIPAVKLKDIDTNGVGIIGEGNAADNGLSSPRLVDLNGDQRPDIAYAGDNLGNMWKFDLTSYDDKDWQVAFNGVPLFTAEGPAAYGNEGRSNPQPITVAPTVRANDRMMEVGTGDDKKTVSKGGMMVAFGTGRNISKTDPQATYVQTLYGVLDNTRYKYRSGTPKRLEVHSGNSCAITANDCIHIPAPATLGKGVVEAKLAQQKFDAVSGADASRTLSIDALNETTWASKNGWYIDLPATSERLLKNMEFYDGTNILTVYSQVPAKGSDLDPNIESCDAGSVDEERQYRSFVNIMDGAAPSVQIMAIVGDFGDTIFSRKQVQKGAHSMINVSDTKNMDIDNKDNKELLNRMPETTSRPSWRQMQ